MRILGDEIVEPVAASGDLSALWWILGIVGCIAAVTAAVIVILAKKKKGGN